MPMAKPAKPASNSFFILFISAPRAGLDASTGVGPEAVSHTQHTAKIATGIGQLWPCLKAAQNGPALAAAFSPAMSTAVTVCLARAARARKWAAETPAPSPPGP